MPTNSTLLIILENLINSLRFSGWTANIDEKDSNENCFVVAEKDNVKIVIKVSNASTTSTDDLKTYAKNHNASFAYLRSANSQKLEQVAL